MCTPPNCGPPLPPAVSASVLKPNGVLLVISYGQPDNRLSYLEKEEYGWTVDVQTVRT